MGIWGILGIEAGISSGIGSGVITGILLKIPRNFGNSGSRIGSALPGIPTGTSSRINPRIPAGIDPEIPRISWEFPIPGILSSLVSSRSFLAIKSRALKAAESRGFLGILAGNSRVPPARTELTPPPCPQQVALEPPLSPGVPCATPAVPRCHFVVPTPDGPCPWRCHL